MATEVIVLNVIDQRGVDTFARHSSWDAMQVERQLEVDIQNEMEAIERDLKKQGFRVKVMVHRRIPFRDILNVEEEEDVSLTVLGSHGVSNIEEMLIGSVSEKVILKAKKPVFIIKG